MAKLVKPFRASRNKGKYRVEGRAKIDSGADATVFGKDVACDLDPNFDERPEAFGEGVGGQRLRGHMVWGVTIRGGEKRGKVDVFVPTHEVVEREGREEFRELRRPPRVLIGHDWLQEAKVRLTFGRRHASMDGVLRSASTKPDGTVSGFVVRRPTKAERALIRRSNLRKVCPIRRKR